MLQKLRKNYIASNGFETFYTDTSRKGYKYRYHKSSKLLYLNDYLLSKSCCVLAGMIYKRRKGAPQGDNLALYLHLSISMLEFEIQLWRDFRYSNHSDTWMDILIVHSFTENIIENTLG